jgi:hypothetical protein
MPLHAIVGLVVLVTPPEAARILVNPPLHTIPSSFRVKYQRRRDSTRVLLVDRPPRLGVLPGRRVPIVLPAPAPMGRGRGRTAALPPPDRPGVRSGCSPAYWHSRLQKCGRRVTARTHDRTEGSWRPFSHHGSPLLETPGARGSAAMSQAAGGMDLSTLSIPLPSLESEGDQSQGERLLLRQTARRWARDTG